VYSTALPLPLGSEALELQEYYERMEQARSAAVEAAVKKYRSLTPALCKVCVSHLPHAGGTCLLGAGAPPHSTSRFTRPVALLHK
jgi:hypothetical protein